MRKVLQDLLLCIFHAEFSSLFFVWNKTIYFCIAEDVTTVVQIEPKGKKNTMTKLESLEEIIQQQVESLNFQRNIIFETVFLYFLFLFTSRLKLKYLRPFTANNSCMLSLFDSSKSFLSFILRLALLTLLYFFRCCCTLLALFVDVCSSLSKCCCYFWKYVLM